MIRPLRPLLSPLSIGIGLGLGRGGSSTPPTDPDAVAWAAAVVTNGGTVSAGTLAAVSAFCVSAKANGYWSKLNRINLFAGTGLAACLTPLKVGGGSATETNVNFVSGDYSEATGLTGTAVTKYLRTGLIPSVSSTLDDTHLSVYDRSGLSNGVMVGAVVDPDRLMVGTTSALHLSDQYNFATARVSAAASAPNGLISASRTSAALLTLYKNGVSVSTNTGASGALPAIECYVFGVNFGGVVALGTDGACGGYAIGAAFSSVEEASYYTDMQAFQTALGRQV